MEERELKEQLASLMQDNGKREELAEFLTEYIDPNHITTDFIGMLLDTKNMKPGEIPVKKVRKGIKVRTLVPGSIVLKDEITVSERANYILDWATVGVLANEWELKSGELGTVESIKAECAAKLRDYYLGKVFTMLSTIWTAGNTPDNFTNVGGTITKVALDNAIKVVNDKVPGGAKAIVGSRNGLLPIREFGAFWSDGVTTTGSQTKIDEVLNSGKLGNYLGVPLVTIDQVYDNPEDYNKMIPEDKILVIGQHVGEFITFGEPMTKEYTDNKPTPPYWVYELAQSFGLIVDNAEGIFVLKIA